MPSTPTAASGAAADPAPTAVLTGREHPHHQRERVREGVTMALYIALSLLAVMVALPVEASTTEGNSPSRTILLTSLGLLVAHALAFQISARFAHKGQIREEHLDFLVSQLIGGAVVTIVAVVPVIVFDDATGMFISELVLVGFIASVGYASARMVPMSRTRAAVRVIGVVVLALGVLWIKSLTGH
jgi:hypothetical protein